MNRSCSEKIKNLQEKFKCLERQTRERAYAIWREDIKKQLEAIDREATEMIRLNKPTYKNKGMVNCRILSSAGYIEFRIHRFYDATRKVSIYPFQYVLGKRHKVTAELREKVALLGVNVPYEKTSKMIEQIVGVKLGKMRIWEGIQQSGKAIRKAIEEKRKKIFKEGDDRDIQEQEPSGLKDRPVVLEADGTFIHVRNEVRQDLLTEGVSEDLLRRGRRAEVKVGVMFRGVARRSKRRNEALAPHTYAEIEKVRKFGEHWYAKCRSDGYDPSKKTTFISDGSAGLRQLRADHFPNALAVLDVYHVERSLEDVLETPTVSEIVKKLYCGNTQEVFRQLESIVSESPPLRRKSIMNVLQYLKDNSDGLNYHRTRIRGSGVVEKLVDNLVKRRFKRQGMSWSVNGANNLLALRSYYLDQINRRKLQNQLSLHTVT